MKVITHLLLITLPTDKDEGYVDQYCMHICTYSRNQPYLQWYTCVACVQ